MRAELLPRRIVFSWLLTSACLRYGIARPSFWLRRRVRKLVRFNNFHSDYPLNLSCFGSLYWSVLEHLRVSCFFVALAAAFSRLREVSRSCLRSPANIAGCWNDLDRGFLIPNHWCTSPSRGRLLGTPFLSKHADQFFAPPHARCVAARMLPEPAPQVLAEPEHSCAPRRGTSGSSSRTICRRVRPTRVTQNHITVGLRDVQEGTESDGNFTVHTARVCSQCTRGVGARDHKSTRDRKEPIMHRSRGAVSFTPLFTTDDIGLRKDASVEHVVKVFLNVGEAMAARWIEMPRGILLLQAVPDQPASGAIYLYDRERHIFFFVDFVNGRDDTLTAAEFDELVAEYDLVSWTANPAFLPARAVNAATA